jgi:hypothetical protein
MQNAYNSKPRDQQSFTAQIILCVPPGFIFSQQTDSMPRINRLAFVTETGQVQYAVNIQNSQ